MATVQWQRVNQWGGAVRVPVIPPDAEDLPLDPIFQQNLEMLLVERGYGLGQVRKLQLGRNPCQHFYIVQYFDRGTPFVFFAEGKRGAYLTAQNMTPPRVRRKAR